MAMSLQDQLSFAEQGLATDRARLDTLTEQRNNIADMGGDTSQIDQEISGLQADVDAGIDEVLGLQQDIDAENAAEQDDTAESDLEEEEAEELDEDEQSQLDDTEEDGDEPGTGDDGSDPYVSNGESTIPDKQRVDATDTTKSADSSGNATVAAKSSVPEYSPRINPLHSFATYTYSIALYILTPEDIAALTKSPRDWRPNLYNSVNTCLIASGGKNSKEYSRNSNFKDDFYFDNLKMTTVIGMNARSKASNAVDISFTVLEPYGMSLLDRIIAVANQIQAPNFKAMPYLLEIDFYGYDDTGKQTKLLDQRKRMPIQIIEFKIKSGTKGSEYAIKAVPWNHQALSQSAATTPINLEVSAETVGDFFADNDNDTSSIIDQDNAKAQARIDNKGLAGEKDAERAKNSADTIKKNDAIIAQAYSASSYTGGFNGWFKDLIIKKLRGTQDKIAFKIHPEIAKTKIVSPSARDLTRSALSTSDEKSNDPSKVAKSANNGQSAFSNKMAFAVTAGTSIPHVIDMVMRNSEYITKQITDPKDTKPSDLAEKLGKPLNWYKVIPAVEIGPYDFALGKFSTITTYSIVPYVVYDSKHPNGPVTAPKGSIKHYYYSYTGKNSDIIDFSIDFDTLFYTAVTAGSAKWQADKIQKAEQQKDEASKVAIEGMSSAKALVNRQLKLISQQPQQQGLGGQQQDAQKILAADIQKNQYSNSRGDMLNLKLKIIGDPELIKQDDIYTNPVQGGYDTQVNSLGIMPDNGSVPMDSGEVIASVEFRTIMDMNEATGLPRKAIEAEQSAFTGQYRILTVDNLFQGGKFEQTIDLIRVPEIANEASASKKSNDPKNNSFPKADTDNNKGRTPTDDEEDSNDDFNPSEVDDSANDNVNEDGDVLNDTEEESPTDEAVQPDDDYNDTTDEEVGDNYEDLSNIEENGEEVNIDDVNETDWI